MKSVLFLIPTLGGGGAERVLVNLANNIDKGKFDVTVQTIFKAGINSKFLNSDVKFKEGRFRQFSGNVLLMKFFSPSFLYWLVIGKQYDIVVSYLEGPATRIVSGCPYHNSQLFAWVHTEQHYLKKAAYSYRSTSEFFRSYSKFSKIIFVAETVKKDFQSICHINLPSIVIYNANEDQIIKEKSKERVDDIIFQDIVNVFTMGRVVPEKAFDRLARVHKRLIEQGVHHSIYHLGGGNTGFLQNYVNNLGICSTFHIIGFRENPYAYLSHADLFVCSSDMEGFSTSVTESLILGIPVVSTNVSGARELLGDHDQYGIVTSVSDDALYDGMLAMLTNPGLLSHYKQKAIERGVSFNKVSSIQSVEYLFGE